LRILKCRAIDDPQRIKQNEIGLEAGPDHATVAQVESLRRQ